MSNSKKSLVVVIMTVIIALFLVLYNYILPNIVTNHRLEKAALSAKHMEVEDGYIFKNILDWWGQPIMINCGPTNDGMAFVYIAISTGRDKISGSSDDLEKVQIDLNKSKMVGQYTAKKLKEFIKGFKDGEKKSSKFDEK